MDDDFLQELVAMNRETVKAHAKFLALKEECAAAKKAYETKQLAVQEALGNYGQSLPLFDGVASATEGEHETDGEVIDVEFIPGIPALPGSSAPPIGPKFSPPPEAWRDETITSLVHRYGFSEKTADLLDEAGIRTIGSLADWNRERNRLTDIPGIGQAKATEIEEIMDQFWSDQANRDVTADAKKGRKKSA